MRKITDIKKQILKDLIQFLVEDTAPWEKPWKTPLLPPQNAVTGKPYRGINLIRLFIKMQTQFHSADPRWCTFLQARQQGWKVRKGSKGTPIVFYEIREKEFIFPVPPEIDTEIDAKSYLLFVNDDFYSLLKKFPDAEISFNNQTGELKVKITYPVLAGHYVFHASQIEDIPNFTPLNNKNFNPIPIYEKLLMPVPNGPQIDIGFRDTACYSVIEDKIYLQKKEQFDNPMEFYCTLLHELCHSTMHEKRLNRYQGNYSGLKEKEKYAVEELIAELGAFIISLKVGLPFNPNSSYSYVKGYIKKYLSKLTFPQLYKIISQAEKAANWIIKEYQLLSDFETIEKEETTISEDRQQISQTFHEIQTTCKVCSAF